jgi:predicted Zn-ribbon and HTH transcriptional regulator
MGALVACESCYFVTRKSSAIGVAGRCPHCERVLERAGLRSQPR